MTTSGIYSFNATRNEIIINALQKVGGIGDGELPTNSQIQTASFYLNALVKNLRGDNLFLWELDWITIPLTASSIVIGTDGENYECIRNHTASSDNKPITGVDYLSFWMPSTETGVTWVIDTNYTSICNVDLGSNIVGISDIKVRQNQNTIIMNELSRNDYASLTQATTPGKPLQWFFFRQFQNPNSIFFYPYPDSTEYVMEGYTYRYPEDFDTGTNTPDFLSEWILPLTLLLAHELAPIYGIFGTQKSQLGSDADKALERARGVDHETGNAQIMPYFGYGSRRWR